MNLLQNTKQKEKTRRRLRFSLPVIALLLLFFINAVSAKGEVQLLQGIKLTLSMKNTTVEQVLREIEKKSNYHFLYNNQLVNVERNVSIDVQNKSINDILTYLFNNNEVEYSVNGNRIILSPKGLNTSQSESLVAQQQSRRVKGRVTDENYEPLPGASIFIKETKRGGITNIDGEFELILSENENTIVFSFLGMEPQTVKVGNQRNLNIKLETVSDLLDEVIVTGYQTISKDRATGSYSVIGPKTLREKLQTNIINRLEGQVAGLVQRGNDVTIRGIATLRGGTEPLIVVDGLPYVGNPENINPNIIENITVLKDAAAASIYGARAANGVIVISTKQGSRDGKTRVNYDASIRFDPIPNYDYLNLLNSKELVDLQQYGFKYVTTNYENLDKRYALNPVQELLYKHKSNLISNDELEKGLNIYRNLDNRQQVKDLYLRTGVTHQHNLSLAGGNTTNRYIASVNYTGNYGNTKYQNNEKLGFTLRDNMKFFDWLSADLAVAGSFNKSNAETGMFPKPYNDLPINSPYGIYAGYPSYYMFLDNNGNSLNIPTTKSQMELDRLRSIGLKDETFNPVTNRQEETYSNVNNYYRVQMGLNFILADGLSFDVKYQTENSSFKNRELYGKNSYKVRSMINDAAVYNSNTRQLTLNVPEGGQLSEARGDTHSYTLRTQLNYMKETDVHYITGLAGAERRLTKSTLTQNYYMGYDDFSLGYKLIDPFKLDDIRGTEALRGHFGWSAAQNNFVRHLEDRFVSFYANAAYTYNRKYNATGSIRIDQSNLFGTDPKYQYRPLWSLGTSWFMGEEEFMKNISWLNQLNIRLTYGIGGNVPKDAGPFLTLNVPFYNPWINDFGSGIKNPPNPQLRWEKTSTTNVGIDFAVLNNRLRGTIDYYNRHTTDLLANRDADPTLGWDQLMLNYGSMRNKGVEVSLSSQIGSRDFQWSPTLNFSYNKNKLIDVDDSNVTAFRYTGGRTSAKGYPIESIFSYRFAELSDQNGTPLYYDAEGEKQTYISSIDDLVFSGTRIPVYTGAFTNRFTYKNFNLSFMLVYYGGHKMRAEAAPYLSMAPGANISREILNLWKQAGDEKNPNTTPGFTGGYLHYEYQHMWAAADKHVVKADYLKLRDLSLSYYFDKKLISPMNMESLSLTLQVQNLWTVWKANKKGLDPEATGTYMYGWGTRTLPSPTTYTLGVSINF